MKNPTTDRIESVNAENAFFLCSLTIYRQVNDDLILSLYCVRFIDITYRG